MKNRIECMLKSKSPHTVERLAEQIKFEPKLINYYIDNPDEYLPLDLAQSIADCYDVPLKFILGHPFKYKRALQDLDPSERTDLARSPSLTKPYWELYFRGCVFEDRNNTNATYKGKAFISMSFHTDEYPELVNIRKAFKTGIEKAGYIPEVVDEIATNNYITLEIFDRIKNCNFLVLDTTVDNCGAYYEAGYARGLNKPVIYCCKKSKFVKESDHFNIRQINHILWTDYDDLISQLATRIELTVV